MVIFILAAAAAYLLCVLYRSPENSLKRLGADAHELRLNLFVFLIAAVLLILVAAVAGPREFGLILLALPIVILIFCVRGLTGELRTLDQPSPPDQRPLLFLLGLLVVAFLGPAAIILLPVGFFWFGPVAVIFAIYALVLGVGLGVFLTYSTHPLAKWLDRRKLQKRWVLGSLVFVALLSALIAWKMDGWSYAVLFTIHHIASAPETAQALLGAGAGLMSGNFSNWTAFAQSLGTGKASTSNEALTHEGAPPPPPQASQSAWPTIIFAAALSCVTLAALVAPYAQSALRHVSGLETPYLKVQFATSAPLADRQQILNVDRDLNILDTIEAFPQTLRFIQYDCAQAAFNANVGIDDFRRDHPEEYGVFTAGLAFRENVIPYISQLINAQRRGDNLVVLKARARQVAEKFALLTNGDFKDHPREARFAFETNFQAAMAEVERQRRLFADEGVGDGVAAEELLRRQKDPDPDYCRPSDEQIRLASDRFDIRNINNIRLVVQQRPRLILGFAATLFLFAGDDGAADAIFASIFHLDPGTDDINTKNSRDAALYGEGRDLREVIQAEQSALRDIEARLAQWERAKVWSEEEVRADQTGAKRGDNKIHRDLVARYDRARLQVRLLLAYVSAQHGLAPEEDLLPERDLYWASAQKYVDDALDSLLDRTKAAPRFECTDDDRDVTIKDTYGFVKLAYQAYTFKTQGIPPDEFQVRRARELLEEALAEAREQLRALEEVRPLMARGGAAPSCFTEVLTKAWVKRISRHLKLADALQP